jgi:hypothetical protein
MVFNRGAKEAASRRGVILMVVLAMLVLFALVGISFVLYADSEATAARINRESEGLRRPDTEPELALALFLGQFIYDLPDDQTGIYSALRGQSLARSLYGGYYQAGGSITNATNAAPIAITSANHGLITGQAVYISGVGGNTAANNTATTPSWMVTVSDANTFSLNGSTGNGAYTSGGAWVPANPQYDKPFNGAGRLHYTSPIAGATSYAADDAYLLNFTYFAGDGFLRDPECYGTRSNLTNLGDLTKRGPYTGGFNVPYTYPDHQNFFLGMMRASDGAVLMQSFHRNWLFNPGTTINDTTNANWTNQAGKYLTLRPRPVDMQVTGMSALFPYPEDPGGDVKNLDWAPSGNDSIWIDINAPVLTMADGRKYKMLVAPLILELDGRLNLNVLGNILGLDANNNVTHASNQGWGACEVNLGKLLNANDPSTNNAEWPYLFLGNPTAGATRVAGRYGVNSRLPQGAAITFGTSPRAYAPVDFNGTVDPSPNTLTAGIELPSSPGTKTVPYQCFPYFPSNGYGNGASTEINNNQSTPVHPLIYNAWRPTSDNRVFPLASLAALLRSGSTGSEALTSELLRLCPTNFLNDTNALKRRNLVTLLSADLDRAGALPYIWDPADQGNPTTRYQFNTNPQASGLWSSLYPTQSQSLSFPSPSTRTTATTPANSEFDPNTWRSNLGQALGLNLPANWRSPPGQSLRLNLNQALTPYPAPYPSAGRFPGDMATQAQLTKAVTDRQQLAQAIFSLLQQATGAMPINSAAALSKDPVNPTLPNAPEYLALRWLAQLAVNIVDFIDQDDYMTPFQWDPTNNVNEFLFGTELPRLVINEVYTQVDNDPKDPQVIAKTKASTFYNVNTWVELLDPLISETGTPQTITQVTNSGVSPIVITSANHGLTTGQQVYITGVGGNTAANNTTTNPAWTITVNDANTFSLNGSTANGDYTTGGTWALVYANQAVLQDSVGPIYRLLVTDPSYYTPTTTYLSNLRNPANVLGDPDYGLNGMIAGQGNTNTNVQTSSGAPASLTAASNTSPIQITSNNHGLTNGQAVIISGVGGNTSANNTSTNPYWLITVVDANTFSLNGSTGNGAYTMGGTWWAPSIVTSWGAAGSQVMVQPVGTSYSDLTQTNQGFFVIGPQSGAVNSSPNLPTITTSPAISYRENLETGTPGYTSPNPTILLQRLACPALPFQNDPTQANYNPYLTIDYVEGFPSIPANGLDNTGKALAVATSHVYDSRSYNTGGTNTSPAGQFYAAWGRNQPYAATNGQPVNPANSQMNLQNPQNPPGNQPSNTFYRHNAFEAAAPPSASTAGQTLQVPFDWLVHLDRQLVSPAELLHVSAFRPHELTQQFYDPGSGKAFGHRAPWTSDQTSRLYRFLELVATANRANGIASGGRVPGKININMIWDKETFEALCDAQAGNLFTQTQVDNLFNALIPQRSPTGDGSGGFMPGASDQPFWSLTPGYYNPPAKSDDALDPNAVTTPATATPRGIANTLLRAGTGTPTAFDPNAADPAPPNNVAGSRATSPYTRQQLLSKIYNNLTTRSNVFAVWLTVGFFEVAKDSNGNYVGDQFSPVKLGTEVGRSEGRQIRHRMFAIVDRTNLQVFSTTSSAVVTVTAGTYGQYTTTTAAVQLAQMSGTNPNTGRAWQVQPGSVLVYEPNTDNEETVVVNGSMQATFARSHASGVTVICRGNPGPWTRYNPRQDSSVVPYFAIID